ncbi:MAG: site-specific DNA-methyltransferase [Candidatus Parabeggiatoa sp. nov. 3]|nr:MAG: site-specific DNA-methyltransferase [Gammaproteobacteria bacterium]RKZ84931.1 MAG: site-specific DNA-methyltransferase [Gammaproteobacteria bacterium]
MNLNENDKNSIIELIKAGEKLPKEFIYKLFADEEDVFLFWNGRREEVTNIALPFHSIEHIDEPREEVIKSGEVLSMFDSRGRQLEGWTNKLIWGDNKLVLSSLINGPLRDEIEREGGLKLIYIDPPFAVGADFGFDIQVGGDSVEKKQSVIEEIAYRDTWGKGISSYLTMMYERLKLMHSLLAEDGSIYVHCDWRVNSHIRLVLDDVFGSENFLNEIIWRRRTNTVKAISNKFSINTDTIFLYTRQRNNYLFNIQYGDYPPEYYERFKYEDEYGKFYWNVMATYSQERLNQLQKEGKVKFSDGAKHPRFKQYLHELKGRPIENVWDDVNMINAMGGERLAYPTQKPEALLERIIKASSNEGDLIADFFSGSGTTAAVAEKLGRKWIATDLGRFAIHTARKRLIGVQRELQKNDKNFRAFEILNLGKYERQFFINDLSNGTKQEDVYLNLILEAYKAKRIAGHTTLHGSKAGRFVHVGPLDVPVTQTRLQEIFTECQKNLYTQVDVLGFEFEMGLTPQYIQELREKGVSITLKYIPKEVFDKRAIEKKQVNFYDVAYLNAKVKKKGKSITVQLTDFVTYYSQDDIEELQQTMRAGSKVVIENGQIIKIDKSGDGIINRTLLTQNWHDWIDYWAIDFNYEDKQEIIKIKNEQGETEAIWSGNYLFENEWQSFRTKKEPTLEFTSIAHEYKQTGKYKIMVKVVDILGIDTSKIIEVKI